MMTDADPMKLAPSAALALAVEVWRPLSGDVSSGWVGDSARDAAASKMALAIAQETIAAEGAAAGGNTVKQRDGARASHRRVLRRVLHEHKARAPGKRLELLLSVCGSLGALTRAATPNTLAYGIGLTAACMLEAVEEEIQASCWTLCQPTHLPRPSHLSD